MSQAATKPGATRVYQPRREGSMSHGRLAANTVLIEREASDETAAAAKLQDRMHKVRS